MRRSRQLSWPKEERISGSCPQALPPIDDNLAGTAFPNPPNQSNFQTNQLLEIRKSYWSLSRHSLNDEVTRPARDQRPKGALTKSFVSPIV